MISLIDKIFESKENFLNGKISETWGNAGYTINNVEANSFIKNTKDIVKWIGAGFGIFNGFKGSKSSRYMYNYIQNVTPIEANYIPDLVQTYSAIGAIRGEHVGDTVREMLKTGRGVKLKQYHQYSKRRYKNRQWEWKAYKVGKTNLSSIVFDRNRFLDSLPKDKKYKILGISTQFHQDNQYYLSWLKSKGLDTFHLVEVTDERPTTKSIGVTLWVGNSEPVRTESETSTITLAHKAKRFPNLIKEGDSQTVKIFELFLDPYDDNPSEDEFTSLVDVNQEELIITAKVTLTKVVKDSFATEYTYQIEEIQTSYDYTEEEHYYLLEDGSTNFASFKDYWFFPTNKNKVLGEQSSKDSKSFDFIAPIPIKDWFEGKDTWQQVIPKLHQNKGIVKAIKDLAEFTSDVFEDNSEELSDSSKVGKRTKNKIDRKSFKSSGKKNYERLGSNKTKELNNNARNIQRFVTTELNRSRKLEFNKDELADVIKYKPKKLKRHIEYLSELVGINYLQYCAGLMSQDHWAGGYEKTNTYQSSIYIGSIFSNQTIENHHYWYEWAKRQYKLYGKEQSYLQWVSSVQNANSENDLPLHVVKYQTTDKTHWGGYSFAFITKFEIDGRVRKIKRKRRLHVILRGKPITIGSLAQLKETLEPLRQVADDRYWESKVSGKEYPIGGESFTGTGYTEGNDPTIRQVLQNFSYTLFCKNSGNGKITCYAICGLQFHTKMSERKFWASAWYDLGMEFQRIREEKVDKKRRSDIQVLMEVETGSRKYRHINRIYNFGIVPIDYNIIKRMNATTLENFAQRATLNYSFLFIEQKKKRSGLKYVRPVVMVVGFIISLILALPSGGSSFAAYAYAVAVATAVSVAVGLAVRFIILPFLKALGLKGIVALIVMIVILIIAAMTSGYLDTSALPYASETTGKVASEVGNQVAQETIKETAKQTTQQIVQSTLKEIGQEIVKQLVGTNIPQILGNAVNYASQATQIQNQKEMESLQQQAQIAQQEYELAIKDLTEKQEEFQQRLAQYDTRAVLESIRQPRYVKNIDLLWESATANINALGSYEYLASFLEQKLSLDVETFDPISSTDFTFKT